MEIGFGLGSNLGDKAGNIGRALDLLFDGRTVRCLAVSSIYRTPPWGYEDQDWFANLCAVGETELTAREALARAKAIERQLGRTPALRWGPRLIDIDILYLDDLVLSEPDLTVPHPGLTKRPFVLVPLAEIRPALRIGGRSIAEALAAVDTAGISPIAPPPRRTADIAGG